MGASKRRVFTAAVGIAAICMLLYFMAGSSINTLSVNGKRSSDWRVKAAGNVVDNDNGSSSVLTSKPILVLIWTTLWRKRWPWGEGARSLRTCPDIVGQCELTSNHSRLKDSDVLLFHMNDKLNLPRPRLRHQKWVFSSMEPPTIIKAKLHAVQGVFNLTMTYARSADVPWTYGRCELLSPATKPNYDKTFNFAASKKHIVAWFVSRCNTSSRRETYVQALRKHINVHQYGCGGKYNCPKSEASACDRRLKDHYKFYLSFENSICRDYVTEKLWRILRLNVVPIVLGNASYSEILPPHSYIDVRDFPSPRHLADYIKLVGANDTLYNEYFRWRAKYFCSRFKKKTHGGCNVCRHALAMRGKTEIVTDLVAEWSPAQNCIEPKQFYRGMDEYL